MKTTLADTIKGWYAQVSLRTKLHLFIMSSMFIILTIAQTLIQDTVREQARISVETRAVTIADGIINGLNMMMLNGVISNPDNRLLFIEKMRETPGVEELHIVRAKQVSDQFGPGLPEEEALDEMDREVLRTGKEKFAIEYDKEGNQLLRVVVPFIAKKEFRGTNCLACHHVEEGSVNGLASITISMEEKERFIESMNAWFWTGQIGIQVILFVLISFIVGHLVFNPLQKIEQAVRKITKDSSGKAPKSILEADLEALSDDLHDLFSNVSSLDNKGKLDLLGKMFEYANEGIIITNTAGMIEAANQTFSKITGYMPEEVIGQNPRIFQSGRHNSDFYKVMWASLLETGQWQGEVWNRRKNGEIYPEWLSIGYIKNESGAISHYIAMFSDITARKSHEETIAYHAYHDALTGLPNRVLFFDRLSISLIHATSIKSQLAILFIDLDRFKVINDTLGHSIGDRLLQEVSKRLRECVYEQDTVARMGGDEFTILLPEVSNVDNVIIVAEKIINILKEPFRDIQGHDLYVTPSIGISIYPEDGKDAQTLIKNADTAMYRAKEHGRNGYQLFDPGMNVRAFERLLLETHLRQALNKGELILYYQPQVDIESRNIIGMEALIRWKHSEMGLVYPEDFIALAEDTGLIIPITEWGIRKACEQNRKWVNTGFSNITVAVNLSARQFAQKNLVSLVAQILDETGLNPSSLDIEITESVAIQNIEHTISVMRELKQLGISISIDDFGTGYSSLNYLKHFPIDTLKIDKSFVSDISEDMDNTAIVKAVIALAHSMKFDVIAEGVETEEQLRFLAEHGCNRAQGHYFHKAMPADEITKILKAQYKK